MNRRYLSRYCSKSITFLKAILLKIKRHHFAPSHPKILLNPESNSPIPPLRAHIASHKPSQNPNPAMVKSHNRRHSVIKRDNQKLTIHSKTASLTKHTNEPGLSVSLNHHVSSRRRRPTRIQPTLLNQDTLKRILDFELLEHSAKATIVSKSLRGLIREMKGNTYP